MFDSYAFEVLLGVLIGTGAALALHLFSIARLRREHRAQLKEVADRFTQAPAPSKPVLRVVRDDPKLCSTCAHFDLAEGQALASRHGPFAVAARYIAPAEMGAVVDADGNVKPRDIPNVAEWSQFGVCALRHEGIWGPTDAARRARMKDKDASPFLENGDCYAPREGSS